jgi:hypothetical protein
LRLLGKHNGWISGVLRDSLVNMREFMPGYDNAKRVLYRSMMALPNAALWLVPKLSPDIVAHYTAVCDALDAMEKPFYPVGSRREGTLVA